MEPIDNEGEKPVAPAEAAVPTEASAATPSELPISTEAATPAPTPTPTATPTATATPAPTETPTEPPVPELSPQALLREAQEKALPVEGKVVAQRGTLGLDVDLGGGILALCPMVEVDVRHKENPGKLVGETLRFLVKEVSEKEILLSRRALLEAESYARVMEARKRAVPGAVLKGRVTSIREFGVFVDIGGIEGLVHVSELTHERGVSPKSVVKVGEEVEVQVLKIEREPGKSDRIALSRKAREPSAFDKAAGALAEGQQVKGKVTRLSDFGAFVEIAPGVQGLVHLSALSPTHIAKPGDVVKEGDEIEVIVLGIDKEKHRISLKRVPSEPELAVAAEEKESRKAERKERRQKAKERKERAKLKPHERLKAGEIVEVTVDRIEPYGLFVKIAGGGRGMIHVSETGTPKGTDLAKEFPTGTHFKAAVLEISGTQPAEERKPRAEGQKPEAEGHEAEAEGQKAEAEQQKAEAEGQKAEAEGQNPEAEGQKAEAEGQRAEAEGQKPEAEGRKPEAKGKKPQVKAQKPEAKASSPKIRLSKMAVEKIEAGATVEAYLTEKALLSAAEKPERPPHRGRPQQRPPRRPQGEGARAASGGAPAAPGATRPAGDRPRRDDRPRRGDDRPRRGDDRPRRGDDRRPREDVVLAKPKPGGLGTFGDLFKAKLAQKKP